MTRSLWFVWPLAVLLAGCPDKKKSVAALGPSPNAGLLPAPLASAGELTGVATGHSSGAIEGIPADSAGRLIVREPEPPPPEVPAVNRPLPEDAFGARDAVGFTLSGVFRWADVPAPAQGAEVSATAIHQAGEATALDVTVDLASVGRLRLSFDSPAFPLPAHTELRAKSSYYGHVLVWPSGTVYRVLAPGSLRAMFAERRADVTPLMRAKVTSEGSGTVIGHKTAVSNVETPLGSVSLEQTTIAGSGSGGELLCRLLVELVGAEPTTEACRADRIPLAAHYKWAGGGTIGFFATQLVERKDLSGGYLYVPPAGATFTAGELPPSAAGVFLTESALALFRTRPVRGGAPGPRAPGEGIIGANLTSALEYLMLDGVAVAWVPPHGEQYVIGPPAGRYNVSWRDFFGANVTPPALVELPAFVRVGTPETDAGAK